MGITALKNKKDIAKVFSTGITVSDAFLRLKIIPNEYTYIRVVVCVPKRLIYNKKKVHKPMRNTQVRRIRAFIGAEHIAGRIAEHTNGNEFFDIAIITKDVTTPFYILKTSFISLIDLFMKKYT